MANNSTSCGGAEGTPSRRRNRRWSLAGNNSLHAPSDSSAIWAARRVKLRILLLRQRRDYVLAVRELASACDPIYTSTFARIFRAFRLVYHVQGFAPLPLSYASRQGSCLLLDGMVRQQTHSSRWILCWLEFIAILGTIEPISPVNSRFQDCDVSVIPYELN